MSNPIITGIIKRPINRRKNAKKLLLAGPEAINIQRFIRVGGIDQWISIRGQKKTNPVLVIVHGGFHSYSIFTPMLQPLEKHFTIVQWDQPGAGRTFTKNNGVMLSRKITIDTIVQDGVEVVKYIQHLLNKDKVAIMGSSIGTIIGTRMVKRYPDLFSVYIGANQNTNVQLDRYPYDVAIERLKARGDIKTIQKIEKLGLDISNWTKEDFRVYQQCMLKAQGNVPNMITDIILPSMLASPDHSLRDIIQLFKGMDYSMESMFDELRYPDGEKLAPSFKVPVFFIQGEEDLSTPTLLVKKYYNNTQAPHKELIIVKDAGHLVEFSKSQQFVEDMITRVRPYAVLKKA